MERKVCKVNGNVVGHEHIFMYNEKLVKSFRSSRVIIRLNIFLISPHTKKKKLNGGW